ncbi:hypothetical protein Tco_0275479, partial [Tanacetum coccineum]
FDKRHIGEDAIISLMDREYRLVPKDPETISDHVLGASGVQIPQDDLGNLRSTEEEDGANEVLDSRYVPGSILLEITDFAIFGLLLEPLVFGTLGLLV